MAVQKYPYEITKIDWYDYISKGESNIPFNFSISMPTNDLFSNDLGSRFLLVAMDANSDNTYSIDNMNMIPLSSNNESRLPNLICSFTLPKELQNGTYYIVLKAETNSTFHSVNTIPTDIKSLSITVIDNMGIPKIDHQEVFRKYTPNNYTFPWKEDPNENN